MSDRHPIREGQLIAGALFNEPMRVETVRANGPDSWVIGLVGAQSERFRRVRRLLIAWLLISAVSSLR